MTKFEGQKSKSNGCPAVDHNYIAEYCSKQRLEQKKSDSDLG